MSLTGRYNKRSGNPERGRDEMEKQKMPEDREKKAIALGYDRENMNAPRVLAAGQGYIARKILEMAEENNIPVEKDPVLAEALLCLDPGQEIPPELYQVVAEVLVFIMEADKRHKKGC